MTRIFLLLLVALMCAPVAFAQQSKDYSFYEFYIGYAHERANNNADKFDQNGTATIGGKAVDFVSENVGFDGFNAEFNQNITRHIGLVTSFSGTYNTTPYRDVKAGKTYNVSVQRYDVMFGPRYNWRPGAVVPFVHGLFGISHVHGNFQNVFTGGKSDTAFAMAIGGGLDIHAGNHLDVRAVQVDWVPTFFNGRRQDNLRLGAGIKIK